MRRLAAVFSQPYPVNNSPAVKLFQAFGLPAAIFIILFVVRPFDLSTAPEPLVLKLALGYAACTLFPLCFNLFIIAPLFDESRWTSGKEILFVVWNFFIIGLVNFIFSIGAGYAGWSLTALLYYLFVTLVVGFVPVSLFVMVNQYRLMNHFLREAKQVNERLSHPAGNTGATSPGEKTNKKTAAFLLGADTPANQLSLSADELVFVQAADNYVEIFRLQENKIQKILFRSTLNKVEEVVSADENFLRVHRGYLVNLSKVVSVSGNAQGFRLHFEGMEQTVPVSRKLNDKIGKLKVK